LTDNKTFDVFKLPYPQIIGFLNYNYVPFYGKISLNKKFVLNLSIYTYVGPGLIIFNHGTKKGAFHFGIGQKLYFNKWIALRGDLGVNSYYGPAPARLDLGTQVQEIPYTQLKPEHKRLIFNIIANIGVVFLI